MLSKYLLKSVFFFVCRELDFVNLMNYDIHGSWEATTGFNAPLRVAAGEKTPENVLATIVKNWINAGCSKEKLTFGTHKMKVRSLKLQNFRASCLLYIG